MTRGHCHQPSQFPEYSWDCLPSTLTHFSLVSIQPALLGLGTFLFATPPLGVFFCLLFSFSLTFEAHLSVPSLRSQCPSNNALLVPVQQALRR